jgi:hypothetical protein
MNDTAVVSPQAASPLEITLPSRPLPRQFAASDEMMLPEHPVPAPWVRDEVDSPPFEDPAIERPPAAAAAPRQWLTARNVAAGFAGLAVLEAAALGGLLLTRVPATVAPSDVPVRIESPIPGAIVMVDGRRVGLTPLDLKVGASVRTISMLSPAERSTERIQPTTPGSVPTQTAAEAAADQAIAQAASRQRSGGVRLVSPIELQVLEGDRVLGSTADGPIVTTAGIHQLDFVNTALGYRSRQSVEIRRGEIVQLAVQPPDGQISINASPWAQVLIDGKPVGETPIANLPLPIGEREIVFRHPQFGERRQTLLVKAGAHARVSANLGQ